MHIIVKQFDSMDSAHDAVETLQRDMAISDDQIGFLTRQGVTDHFEVPSELQTDDLSGSEGALLGGMAGLVTAAVAMATPLGPLIAAGPFLGVLIGTLAGAATGGAVATLVENHNVDRATAERLAALLESDEAVLLSVEVPEALADEVEAKLASVQALAADVRHAYDAQPAESAIADEEAFRAAYLWGSRAASQTTRDFTDMESVLQHRYPGDYERDRAAIQAGFERHRTTVVRL